jgi:T5SS/PEP-CTERM-associated repeat protein
MKHIVTFKPAWLAGILSAVMLAQAEDNTTNFLFTDGLLHTISGNAVVGNTGTNNYGEVSNGSVLTNSGGYGIVSLYSPAAHNLAVVSGSGSLWTVDPSYPMVVGFFSGEADLLVTNSGRVYSPGGGIIGYYYDTVSNNTVTVTGSGSRWDIGSYLWVGGNGYNNSLIISDGATVTNTGATTMGVGVGSSNNLVLVTGSGSRFVTLGSDFGLGGGGGNSLIIANGGYHESINFRTFGGSAPNSILITNGGFAKTLGLSFGESATVGGNLFKVADAGSVYTNAGLAILGMRSSNNVLQVQDGGKMYVSGDTFIGGYFGTAGAYNSIQVSGSGSLLALNGASTYFGYAGNGNTISITEGGQANANTFYNNTSSNVLTVSGGGSTLQINTYFGPGFGGSGNQFIVTNGGKIVTPYTAMGYSGNSTLIEITGSGSVYSNAGLLQMTVVGAGSNTVAVRNGGSLYVGDSINVGNGTSQGDTLITTGGGTVKVLTNLVLGNSHRTSGFISDPGSVWDVGLTLYVGNLYANNTLTITNGGFVKSAQGIIGNYGLLYGYPGTNNSVVVTGAGSVWSNTLYGLYVGNVGESGQLRIENGGKVYNSAVSYSTVMGNASSATNNRIIVTGAGSLLSTPNQEMIIGSAGGSNAVYVTDGGRMNVGITLFVGSLSPKNYLEVTDGGEVYSAQGIIGYLGSPSYNAHHNAVLVSGTGSVWSNSTYPIYVGYQGVSNTLTVANGGKVYTPTLHVGFTASASNNTVNLSGDGSLLRANSGAYVGYTGTTLGDKARLNISNGGTLDTPAMYAGLGSSGIISNSGGIYQFPTASPTVYTNTAGTITLTDGTVSYRGVNGANIYNAQVSNITFAGNNAFRLNNSTNASTSYTFDSVANTGNPRNYQRLVLINNSRWVGGSLTIGTGGGLTAEAGSTVDLTGNLTINDANNYDVSFDLSGATVTFTGGGNHTNAVTGKDLGNDGLVGYADGFTAFNYSYGTLKLGSTTDHIYFISGDGASSNALYVLNLELPGNDTNWVANLHAPASINIYYGISPALSPANAYLNNLVYNLPGGGLLLPAIPEPSSAMLLLAAGLAVAARRRRQ